MDRKEWTPTPTVTTDEENNLLDASPETPIPRHSPHRGRKIAAMALLAAVVFATALYFRLRTRQAVRQDLAATVEESTRTPVSVVHPQKGGAHLSVTFPANLQGYIETPIYARTNGYVKRWLVDIGAHVT